MLDGDCLITLSYSSRDHHSTDMLHVLQNEWNSFLSDQMKQQCDKQMCYMQRILNSYLSSQCEPTSSGPLSEMDSVES